MTISGNALKEGRLGKPQKNLFLMTVPLRGGGGLAIKKEKKTFFMIILNLLKKFRLPLSSRGVGGVLGLNGTAIKKKKKILRLPLATCGSSTHIKLHQVGLS